MTRGKKEPTDAELVEMLARRFHITLQPAGGREFDVVLPDMQLCVEITMRVHHQATKDEQVNFRKTALEMLAAFDRGWTDRCDCQVKDRGPFSARGSMSGCRLPVIGVVVYKSPGTWQLRTGEYDSTKPSYHYSFRCRTHMDKPGRDERAAVYSETFVHEVKTAREERAKAIAERDRLTKMTPEERIAEDARMVMRFADAETIRKNETQPARWTFKPDDLVEFTETAKAKGGPECPAAMVAGPWIVHEVERHSDGIDSVRVRPVAHDTQEVGVVRCCRQEDLQPAAGRSPV